MKKPAWALRLVLGTLVTIAVAVFFAGASGQESSAPPIGLTGQSQTLLADGQWLLTGGETQSVPVSAAYLWDPATGVTQSLTGGLKVARAWHSASVVADGSVLIIGGVDDLGSTLSAAERFNPRTAGFSAVSIPGITARSHHTTTLLSNGQLLIVGGFASDGTTLANAELVDPRTLAVTAAGSLNIPRSGHSATLLADGTVLVQGGVDATGKPAAVAELYEPQQNRFVETSQTASNAPSPGGPLAVWTNPPDGAGNVPLNPVISIRFSEPLRVQTVNSSTVVLNGPLGTEIVKVVPAERGMLAFVAPQASLQPGTTYLVTIQGAEDNSGARISPTAFSFTTVAQASGSAPAISTAGGSGSSSDDQVWIPNGSNWVTGLPPSPWQSLPPLRAPSGVTALAGQVLKLNGQPLPGVTLEIGNQQVRSDGTGRFLLTGIPASKQLLTIDGGSANIPGKTYGVFQVGIWIASQQTTVLDFTIWMPLLDTAHAITVPSPTTSEVVLTNPYMSGLELQIPANTVIRDYDGNIVNTIGMTPIPLDRPPFPLPIGVEVPIYFTIQPGGAYLYTASGERQGARLIYPNSVGQPPGARFDFWNYGLQNLDWYIYGHGTVSPDGKQVIPDPGVEIYGFTGAMVGGPSLAPASPNPPPAPNCCLLGYPVDPSTGLVIETHTDFFLPDVIPIDFSRTYRSGDQRSRPLGIGATDSYEVFLVGNILPWTYQYLILQDGSRVYFPRTSSGTGFSDAVYQNTTAPGPWFGSVITYNGAGWNLKRRDGTTYVFPDSFQTTNPAKAAVIKLIDRNGNTLTITRDSNGNITQITSPNGRWLQFTHDSTNRITQIQDNIGRTVNYAYNPNGQLATFTDQNGGTTQYTYQNALFQIFDPRGNKLTENHYDTAGRLVSQSMQDRMWQFGYKLDANGNVTSTIITDPLQITERRDYQVFIDPGDGSSGSSNANGFLARDILAWYAPEQETFTYKYDPNSRLVQAATDQLGRQTSYTYDSLSNLTSVTRLAGTPQAVTTSFTYDATFNQLTSVTDPLGHSYALSLDSHGNPVTIADPLNHQTTLMYDAQGKPLSIADPANDTAHFSYYLGDLSAVSDPLGNTTSLFTDGAGRKVSITDPAGQTTLFAYDPLNRLTTSTDANGGVTSFSYDPDSNLLSVTDAHAGVTSYVYDQFNELNSRTDPLNAQETYQYDKDRNVVQFTDRRGKVANFSYDGINRRTFAGFGYNGIGFESTINYGWDGGDRLTNAVDSIAGKMVRAYDGLDRLTSEATPRGSISYGYDNAGRRTSMTVNGQTQVSYTWDNANRLTGLAQGSSSVALNYDAANRRTSLILPNNVTVAYTYDTDSHVTGMTYSVGNKQLGTLSYRYDADGRIVERSGSLAGTSLPAAVSSATYDAANRLTRWNNVPLQYDANGNLTNDGTNGYTWDARNHLTAIFQGIAASFVYDAFGRRVNKTISGTTTQFLYDGLNPVQD